MGISKSFNIYMRTARFEMTKKDCVISTEPACPVGRSSKEKSHVQFDHLSFTRGFLTGLSLIRNDNYLYVVSKRLAGSQVLCVKFL